MKRASPAASIAKEPPTYPANASVKVAACAAKESSCAGMISKFTGPGDYFGLTIAGESEPLGIVLQRGDDSRDHFFHRPPKLSGTAHDVVAIHGSGEGLVLHLFLHG